MTAMQRSSSENDSLIRLADRSEAFNGRFGLAEKDDTNDGKDYGLQVPFAQSGGFYLKGIDHCDWGMKTRMSRIFNPGSGRTVMLAFDHGYIMGSTRGLERLDLAVPPLVSHVDALDRKSVV